MTASRLCPTCRRPAVESHRPFCSPRCAEVDLGRWFSGRFVLPGAPPADEAEEED